MLGQVKAFLEMFIKRQRLVVQNLKTTTFGKAYCKHSRSFLFIFYFLDIA